MLLELIALCATAAHAVTCTAIGALFCYESEYSEYTLIKND